MSIARHELCQWIENGIQCSEIALNDRRWCNEHLGDAYKWIAKSHCIIKKKDELIQGLKDTQKIRDNLIDVQRELIKVLEETIEVLDNNILLEELLHIVEVY